MSIPDWWVWLGAGSGRLGKTWLFAALAVSASVLIAPAVADAGPRFDWKACGSQAAPTARCAGFAVPFDYSKPQGRKFRLAVVKVPATGNRRGTLFFNPGGPGVSGVEQVRQGLASALPPSIRRSFDLFSWDPRGVGRTRPAISGCRGLENGGNPLPPTGAPTSQQWRTALAESRKQQRELALQCLPLNRDFARHMGTNNVVRDLDRMRGAVGDRKLTFWGASYGTRIGYVYALRFPGRLRALLLDGSVDPTRGYRDFARLRSQAADRALEVMGLGSVRPAFANEILDTWNDLRTNGPVISEGVEFTQWDFSRFVALLLPSQASWPVIQQLIDDVEQLRAGGRRSGRAADAIEDALERLREPPLYPGATTPRDGGPGGNALLTNSIINYLDYGDSAIPFDVAERILLDGVGRYPFATGLIAAQLTSSAAGLTSMRRDPVPLIRKGSRFAGIARKANNVLISGSTGDGATPYPWTNEMASVFRRAALIRYDGWQHVNWTALDSTCVNDPITSFILTGRKPDPARPALCPFAPPGPPASG